MRQRFTWLLSLALVGGAEADLATDWAHDQNEAVARWDDRATEFADAVAQQCGTDPDHRLDGEQRQALMPAWHELVEAWGVVASQGPAAIDELGLGYRIAFWPDSRGMVARQMETHVEQRRTGTYESLQIGGHGIQGVDWMLAQPEPDCRLMLDWSEHYTTYSEQILEAMPDRLRLANQAVSIAANELYAQASRLNQRLREVISEPDGRYRPYMGDLSQTHQSVRLIRAGLRDLGERLVLFSERLPDERMVAGARQRRETLAELADTLPDQWPDNSEDAWAMASRIRVVNQDVESWLSEDVANAYSLLIGFNNQDGD